MMTTPIGPPAATVRFAPELAVSRWFNSLAAVTLASLKGRPVYMHSFQLLCPGCVAHSIPQVKRIERIFSNSDLQVIGIHTVFEHHAAMMPVTLEAFLHEYRISHPVGVDQADGASDIPITMRRYGFRGTPSSVLIGRDGSIIHQNFGVEDDIAVGAHIALALSATGHSVAAEHADGETRCSKERCEVPPLREGGE